MVALLMVASSCAFADADPCTGWIPVAFAPNVKGQSAIGDEAICFGAGSLDYIFLVQNTSPAAAPPIDGFYVDVGGAAPGALPALQYGTQLGGADAAIGFPAVMAGDLPPANLAASTGIISNEFGATNPYSPILGKYWSKERQHHGRPQTPRSAAGFSG